MKSSKPISYCDLSKDIENNTPGIIRCDYLHLEKNKTMIKTRGFYGIGIYHPKTSSNVGTLWRTANILKASFIYTIGRRYKHQCSDTMKTLRHIPLYHYTDFDDCKNHLPKGCRLVAIEITPNAKMLNNYSHPQQACYLLGAEDSGIPKDVLDKCHDVIQLGGSHCMNVAVAGSIVIYHRMLINLRMLL
jgi:tRNA G18 (ribose-2'-O)-methylase SpoU